MKIITWDYKEQPPMDEIQQALDEHRNTPQIVMVESGSDQFAAVVYEYGENTNPQAWYDEHRND